MKIRLGSVRAPDFESPFYAGGTTVRPDRGAVDHLQQVGVAAAVGEALQHHVPNAGLAPAAELPPGRVPIAELGGQITPRRAGAGDPEDGVQNAAVIAGRAAALRAGRGHERFEQASLFIGHQAPGHRQPPSWRLGRNHTAPRQGNPLFSGLSTGPSL